MMSASLHTVMLSTVARGLGHLKEKIVFVGGATVELYITDPAAPDVRLSDDIDCIVEVATKNQYYELESTLRQQGFKEPPGEGHPVCRWIYSGIIVDIMPTDEKILGFSNRWYHDGILKAQKIFLPDGIDISVFSPPYLIASKIEAFKGRGHGDFLGSPDLEDIVALIDGRKELINEIDKSDIKVRTYLIKEFQTYLRKNPFVEAIRNHSESLEPSGRRAEYALSVMKKIATMQT